MKLPVLEVKIKKGFVGDKFKIPLDREQLIKSNFRLIGILKKSLITNELNDILSFLKPVVFVSYKRNYYNAYSDNFRFTFDRDISFKIIKKQITKI